MGIITASMVLSSCGSAQKIEETVETESVKENMDYSKIEQDSEEVSHIMADLKDDSYREVTGEPFGEDGMWVSAEISRSVFPAGELSAVQAILRNENGMLALSEDYDAMSGNLTLTNEETGVEIQQELELKGGMLFATYSVDTPGTYEARVMISDENFGTGYSDTFEVRIIDPSTVEGQAEAERPHEQWREAYVELLKELEETADSANSYYYDMAQIDGDGVPELIVSAAETGQQNGVRIYTFKYGKISELGEFGTWGNVEYVAGKGIIIDTKGSDTGSMMYTFYDMSGNSVQEKSQLRMTEGETAAYYIEEEETDKVTYEETFSELAGLPQNEITVKGSSTGRNLTDTYTAEEFINGYPWYSHMDMTKREIGA